VVRPAPAPPDHPPVVASGFVPRDRVIAMRRNDIDTEPDINVTDRHTVEVKVRERFLAPR
jgi:hypothetical protein